MYTPRYLVARDGWRKGRGSWVGVQMMGLVSHGVPSGCLPVAKVFPVLSVKLCLIIKVETTSFRACRVGMSEAMMWVSSQKPWELIYTSPRE